MPVAVPLSVIDSTDVVWCDLSVELIAMTPGKCSSCLESGEECECIGISERHLRTVDEDRGMGFSFSCSYRMRNRGLSSHIFFAVVGLSKALRMEMRYARDDVPHTARSGSLFRAPVCTLACRRGVCIWSRTRRLLGRCAAPGLGVSRGTKVGRIQVTRMGVSQARLNTLLHPSPAHLP
jgi:hypothetical protein